MSGPGTGVSPGANKGAVRLILDPPGEGAWNMAMDEALLESAAEEGWATLRLYRWQAPTLSLGYFQRYEERWGHEPSAACPVVRRSSGGGAILHDRELTYSFTAVIGDRVSPSVQALYAAFHATLVDVLRSLGAEAERWPGPDTATSAAAPFLCFQRRAEGDVVLGGGKVCGSAQRRRRRAVLQHGSVLLSRSDFAPELPGIRDLFGGSFPEEEFASKWLEALPSALNIRIVEGNATSAERRRAAHVVREKHSRESWIRRR